MHNAPPFYGCRSYNGRSYNDGTESAGLVTLAGLICDDQLNVMGNDGTTQSRACTPRATVSRRPVRQLALHAECG